ncbi:MAG: GDP-mannose 4,6-dehydratase [Candidatus Omnitrophica bacterium]|nr:GDP-mannose 4,6-dehydratase [Candidatus Omnitrophota bacterium]
MAASFWKNKKVLITGYEGFLGSWLTKFLLDAGARITGLDIVTNRAKTVLTKADRARIRIVKGSVENSGLLSRVCVAASAEFVFHLGARALVGECYENPRKAFQVNIGGTWNVLEACRAHKGIKGLIVASSDKAYGSHAKLPYREDFALRGDHPYDVSKSCADLLSDTYAHTYGIPVCITRCGNLYGPGDYNFSRIIPDAIRCGLTGTELVIRSDGKYVRDYVYVKDIALAYMLLAEKILTTGIAGEAFNFSDERPLSVIGIVKEIYRLLGGTPRYSILNQAGFEIREQFLSSAKARRMLGWKPAYTLRRGLQETIQWYRTLIPGGTR